MKRSHLSRHVPRAERKRRARQFRWAVVISLLVGIAPWLIAFVLLRPAPMLSGYVLFGFVPVLILPGSGFVGLLARNIRQALIFAGLVLSPTFCTSLAVDLIRSGSIPGQAMLSVVLLYGGCAFGGCIGGYVIAWISGITQFGDPPQSSLTCEKCGYLLVGLSERRCPECGTPFGERESSASDNLG